MIDRKGKQQARASDNTDKKGATGKTSNISILPVPTVTPQVTDRHPPGDGLRKKALEYVLISAETGEEVARYVSDGRAVPKTGDWIRLYQSFAEQVASDPNTQLEARALWLVVARAGFGNLARINVSEVARTWGVSRKALSESMSRLVRRRIIERAKGGAFRLNPNFCWKGDAGLRTSMQAQWHAHQSDDAPAAAPLREASA